MQGLKGQIIRVEATVWDDKEQCIIIGLPDASIKESKERILNCLLSLGIDTNMKKITILLSPSDVKKQGTSYDAAMLLAVLQAMSNEPIQIPEKTCFIAALTLDGHLTTFNSIIPTIHQAMLLGFKKIFIPPIDISLFLEIPDVELVRVAHIKDLLSHLRENRPLSDAELELIPLETLPNAPEETPYICFSAIRGHKQPKRALTLAAAGGYHVLMTGPPGCGKSLLANAFHTILPDLTNDEKLEVYSIYQMAMQARDLGLRPPIRSPHHSISEGAIIGGGRYPKPGEISLAHRGVLFLDELGHFPRRVIDTLRQPLESGIAVVNRVEGSNQFPATINLMGATNPCPCGYYGSNERYCTCTEKMRLKYIMKITGPIIDRIDFVLGLQNQGILTQTLSETSEEIRCKVAAARAMQLTRYRYNYTNAIVPVKLFERKVIFSEAQLSSVQNFCFKAKISSRSTMKILRLARTVSDLEGDLLATDQAVTEALEWTRQAAIVHTTFLK